jgi:hypothetical protein
MYKSWNIGFTRTHTIANGAPKCDFRFKKGGKTGEGWPPDKLKDWKEQNRLKNCNTSCFDCF